MVAIVVKCRQCNAESSFEGEQEAIESDWVQESSLAVVKDDHHMYKALCPEHSDGKVNMSLREE